MINLGTIGSGYVTRALASATAAMSGISIACAYSRDPERAAAVADDIGARKHTSSLEHMLADDEIDAIYIASPNSLHHRQALAAIEAGKHVLVEKPATPTSAEWEQLVDAAHGNEVVILEGIRNEYDPGMRVLEGILPDLGTIRRVSFRLHKRSARYDTVLAGGQANIFDPRMAGGALLDLGVYCIHPMVALFDEPVSIQAASIPIASGVDGAGIIFATYPDMVADLSYSKITTSTLPSEIQGEDATLHIDHITSPRLLTIQRRDGRSSEVSLRQPAGTLNHEVARFVQLLVTGESADSDHDRTRKTLRLVDAARRGGGRT